MTDSDSAAAPTVRMPRFDLIVFDWDGTLFDSTTLIARCLQAACADVGQPVPSETDARYVIGLGLGEALAHVAPALAPERYPLLSERYRHHYFARKDDLVLFDGVMALLQALKAQGRRLAVATGKSRRGLDEVLQSSQLGHLFDATRTADETHSKPHPRMLLELMDELDVPPDRTLMIGDTTHDLQLAANAGTAAVAVGYGAHAADTFAGFKPLHVAHAVADLAAWLDAHG